MADGIVGAISLGFQVTKGLVEYYSAFRSHNSDIASVTNKIELVSNVFERLQATIQDLTPIESSTELTKLLEACTTCLNELEVYRDKCSKKKHAPELLKDRAGRIIKRSVYPFRKSTLDGLQNTLDSLSGILQLMMHITHLDTGKYWYEQILLRHEHVQQALNAISAGQSAHAVCLHSIQLQLGTITESLHTQHAITHHGIQTMSSQLTILNDHLGTLGLAPRRSIQLETPHQADATPKLTPKPSLTINSSQHHSFGGAHCLCSRRKTQKISNAKGYMGFFRTKVSPHQPRCPLYFHSRVVTLMGVKFRLYIGKGSYLLETGVQYWESGIAPHIRYRNVVSPKHSPAFQLIEILSFGISPQINFLEFLDMMDFTLRALSDIFRQGRASIFDMDERGGTLVHSLMKLLSFRDYILPVIFSTAMNKSDGPTLINEIIRLLGHMGFEMNHRNNVGYTPLDVLIRLNLPVRTRTLINAGIPALIELECSCDDKFEWNLWSHRIDAFQELARHPSNGLTDHPVVLGILNKSENDLRNHLARRQNFDEDIEDFDLVKAAIAWPEGLHILFTHGVSSGYIDDMGFSVLDYILNGSDLSLWELMSELDTVPITKHTWRLANRWSHFRTNDALKPIYLGLLIKIAAQLAKCAQDWTVRTRKPLSTLTSNAESDTLEYAYGLPYHIADLTVAGAQALFESGFRDINCQDCKGRTPMHILSRGLTMMIFWRETLRTIQWLYNNGAFIAARHPNSGTPISHVLAQGIINIVPFQDTSHTADLRDIFPELDESSPILLEVFYDSARDNCVCFCSTNGCDVATSILRMPPYKLSYKDVRPYMKRKLMFLAMILDRLGTPPDQSLQQLQSALRVMTFHALGMTHTCYDHGIDEHELFGRMHVHNPTPEDISACQNIDAKDAGRLDQLMIEFEGACLIYGSFLEFVEGYWEPRMEEVLHERNKTFADTKELNAIGVYLNIQDTDDFAPVRRVLIKDVDLTKFKRLVKAIVEDEESDELNAVLNGTPFIDW